MAFVKSNFVNGTTPPISAENLNKIEDGVEFSYNSVENYTYGDFPHKPLAYTSKGYLYNASNSATVDLYAKAGYVFEGFNRVTQNGSASTYAVAKTICELVRPSVITTVGTKVKISIWAKLATGISSVQLRRILLSSGLNMNPANANIMLIEYPTLVNGWNEIELEVASYVDATRLKYINIFVTASTLTAIKSVDSLYIYSNVKVSEAYLSKQSEELIGFDPTTESALALFNVGENKYNPTKVKPGYLKDATGALQSGTYVTSDPIYIGDFVKGYYCNTDMRKLLFYDASLQPIAASFVSSNTAAGVLTLNPDYKYVRISFHDSYSNIMFCDSDEAVNYKEFELVAKDGYNYLNENTKNAVLDIVQPDHNMVDKLYDKKWAVCGDSFSAGADTGTLPDGKYVGQKIVYPYIIGNRTGINVLNFFNNGRTLAFPEEPDDFVNSLTAPGQTWNYQNIPADVDYITIYLGINDRHHATGGGDDEDPTGYIPLGEITDNTIYSYYGAWNVVLTWLISNRPFAHIGIIVTNGVSSAYREAQIEIAKKYGIPYIDMNGDSRTPCMIRSCNTDVDSDIRDAINLKQRISSTNLHPNNDTHKYEATFIEEFLRSL